MTALHALLLPLLLLCSSLADGWFGVFLAANDPPRIAEVIPGSPAAKAGLKVGDRILAVNDSAVTTRDGFIATVRAGKPGDKVKCKIDRGGSEMVVTVRLGERPAEDQIPEPSERGEEEKAGDKKEEKPAPTVEAKEPKAAPKVIVLQEPKAARPFLGVALESADGGLRITRVIAGSPAATAGLQAGEVLQKFGDDNVKSMDQLTELLGKCKAGQKVSLQLGGEKGTRSVLLELGKAAGAQPVQVEVSEPAKEPTKLAPRQARAPRAPRAPQDDKAPAIATAPAVEVHFLDDFGAAVAQSKTDNKPLVVVFGAAWNSSCQAQRKAIADKAMGAMPARCLWAWIDTDKAGELAGHHQVKELPTIEVMVGGEVVARHEGYLPPERLRAFVAEGVRGKTKGQPSQPEAAVRPVPRHPGAAANPAAPAPAATPDVEAELQQLRAELRELRQLLEELRKK